MLLLGHVSKIVSILLSKLSNCPNTDTLLCYCNYPFLIVHSWYPQVVHQLIERKQSEIRKVHPGLTCFSDGVRRIEMKDIPGICERQCDPARDSVTQLETV